MTHVAGWILLTQHIAISGLNMLGHLLHVEGIVLGGLFIAREVPRKVTMRTTDTKTSFHMVHGVLVELYGVKRDIRPGSDCQNRQISQRETEVIRQCILIRWPSDRQSLTQVAGSAGHLCAGRALIDGE